MAAEGGTLLSNVVVVGDDLLASRHERPPPIEAVLIHDGRIAWQGAAADAPSADVTVNLDGRWLLPGLTDAHSHLLVTAQDRLQVTLDGPQHRTIADVLDTIRVATTGLASGEWLAATRLHSENLVENRFPTRRELDQAVPDRPVVIRVLGGHAAVVNSRALEAADADSATRGLLASADDRQRVAGFLTERLAKALFDLQPIPSAGRLAEAIVAVARDYHGVGVTSVVEAAVGFTNGFDEEWKVWELLRSAGQFPVRMGFMLRLDYEDAVSRGLRPGPIHDDWQIRTLKFFADGIVGARTASFLDGYCDDPENLGDLLYPVEQLVEQFASAHRAGWQLAVHAIGDRAIDDVLTAYAACGRGSMRHRIEHLALPSEAHVRAVAQLGLTVVTQYGFLPIMGDMFASALGHERAEQMYPGRRLLDAGIAVAGSSDHPIGPLSPFAAIMSGQDRATGQGQVLAPGEALRPAEALRLYTEAGPDVMFQEATRGRVAVGLNADLTVVDGDPLASDANQIGRMESTLTLVRGEIVLDRR